MSPFVHCYNNVLMRHELEEIGFKHKEIEAMTQFDVDIYLSIHKRNVEQSKNNEIGGI